MTIVRNDTQWYLIYEDSNGVYHILAPDEVKKLKDPVYRDANMEMETAEITLRTMLGEKIRCYDPVSGRYFFWS